MKVQYTKNKKNLKLVLVSLSIVVIALLGFAAVYATSGSIFGWQPFGSSSKDDLKEAQSKNAEKIKQDSIDNSGKSGSDQPLTPTEDTDGKKKVEVDIVSANRVESTLKVSALISVLDQAGTCTITISDTTTKKTLYTNTVGVQALSNTSTCKGFDIDATNIQDGKFTITLNYTSGTMYGTAVYVSK